jgi:hypothetical protein
MVFRVMFFSFLSFVVFSVSVFAFSFFVVSSDLEVFSSQKEMLSREGFRVVKDSLSEF